MAHGGRNDDPHARPYKMQQTRLYLVYNSTKLRVRLMSMLIVCRRVQREASAGEAAQCLSAVPH